MYLSHNKFPSIAILHYDVFAHEFEWCFNFSLYCNIASYTVYKLPIDTVIAKPKAGRPAAVYCLFQSHPHVQQKLN